MTWHLRDEPDALGVAASLIEHTTGVPAAHVEKDFWVTEALRAAAAQAADDGVTLVFKGGTSLSKAHCLIRRFSEDIDLIVVVPADSRTAADRCLKGISDAVEIALDIAGDVDSASATKGRKRTTRFEYPTVHESGVLSAGVLLELGARGGTLPAELMAVRSLVAEHGQTAELDTSFEEAAPFEIRVLHPTRTLVEKLMILHHAAVGGDKDERARLARHYYDVWCLLGDDATIRGLEDWPCDALAKEVEAHTKDAGLDTSPRPGEGFAASLAFSERTRAVRNAFEGQVLDQLVWGPPEEKPTLDDCCDLVQSLAARL